MEIFIPVEAEVKSIFLGSLPKSVFKHIERESSSKLAESPVGIWICPVVLQKKGQKQTSHPGSSKEQNLSWPIDIAVGSCRMSFVSRNRTAYSVLKETIPGPKSTAHTSNTLMLTPCSASQTKESAVIIYQGHIYLKVKKNSHQGTSHLSSQSVKKRQSHQASLGSESNELHRKRSRTAVSEVARKQLENPLTNTHNTHQELLTDNSARKQQPTFKVTQSDRRVNDEEAESTVQINGRNIHLEQQSGSNPEQSSNQSLTKREPSGSSISPQQKCDFAVLANEERIAQMKAKLKKNEEAVNNL
ncbi:uncharacterized protein V6R79_010764 [Siganus canaliculatus]